MKGLFMKMLLLFSIFLLVSCTSYKQKNDIEGNWYGFLKGVYYEFYIDSDKFTIMDDNFMGNSPISKCVIKNGFIEFLIDQQTIKKMPYSFSDADTLLRIFIFNDWIELKRIKDTIDFYEIGDNDWEKYNQFLFNFKLRAQKFKYHTQEKNK